MLSSHELYPAKLSLFWKSSKSLGMENKFVTKAQEWKADLASTYGFSVVPFCDLNVSDPVFTPLVSASQ